MKMRLISLHWLALSAILITGSQAYDEEDEEMTSSGTSGRWSLHRERRHWHAAALACRRPPSGGGHGGRLAVPKSPREARALGRLLTRAFPHPVDAPWVYLGLHDLAERGEFVSEDGVPIWTLGNLRWHAWDARGGPMDQCVVLDRFGLLWDVPCTWHLPFVCTLPPPSAEPTEPPCLTLESQEEDETKNFELHKRPSNWWSALAKCARTGGHLAMPHGSFHTHALRDLLREGHVAAEDVSVLRAFVGISDLARGGHLRNLHGEPFSLSQSDYQRIYSPMDDEEATSRDNDVLVASRLSGVEEVNVSVGEDDDNNDMDPIAVPPGATCLVLNGAGMYESASCTSQLPFFCELPPTPTACPTPPPPPPDPRMLPPPPGHFWLQQGKVTWKQAAKGCLDAGGVLAVPETPGEALALADLLRSVPHPSDENIGSDIWAYVGIKDFAENGDFFTIFGVNASVTTEEAAPWGPGQPNGEGSQPCVVLDRDATLWDVSCEWELGYLCRRFPAEPPWATRGPFAPAGNRGVSWRVKSQETRRWLRDMEALGAGAALATEDGQEHKIGETSRGFARVDLRSWIDEFDEGGLFDYAKFDFTDPDAIRT